MHKGTVSNFAAQNVIKENVIKEHKTIIIGSDNGKDEAILITT